MMMNNYHFSQSAEKINAIIIVNGIRKMLRVMLFLLTISFAFSCNEGVQKKFPAIQFDEEKISNSINHKNIRFDFKAENIEFIKPNNMELEKSSVIPKFQIEILKIQGTLFNNNLDTVYFLSSSCDGMQYSLQYDTAVFKLWNTRYCYLDVPVIEEISPNGKIDFEANFMSVKKIKMIEKIKLGFDFYEVDKSFDLNKVSITKIHHRSDNVKNIIWADN
ncbi:MAG: hypothetical protein ABI723_05015 [Bacteroidia bacterium]